MITKAKYNLPGYDNDAIFKLWRLLDHTRFMIARLREQELARQGVTAIQVYVLDILNCMGGSTTINDILAITGRRHHTISTLINRMSIRGLVSRKKNDTDNRKWEVSITPEGAELFARISRDYIHQIFGILSPEDCEELERVLTRLLSTAYDMQGETNTPRFIPTNE